MSRFFVYGEPRPGGSKVAYVNKHTGKAMIVDACKKNKSWRDSVATYAIESGVKKAVHPVSLDMTFYFQRPKSHYRTGKFTGMLRDDAPKTKASKPDLTKLIRSTEDALTGIAWNDDASVVHQVARKLYCDNKNPNPGCLIEIEECEE